jgi:hypothetical protein
MHTYRPGNLRDEIPKKEALAHPGLYRHGRRRRLQILHAQAFIFVIDIRRLFVI